MPSAVHIETYVFIVLLDGEVHSVWGDAKRAAKEALSLAGKGKVTVSKRRVR